MGSVTFGIPRDVATELAGLVGASVFVETGTYHGQTTRWAAQRFAEVHTIERSQSLFEQHSQQLTALTVVTPHFGDSRNVLPGIVAELGERRALFWFDGHWCSGDSAGRGDECPLLGELACLAGRTGDIVMIDDARYFLKAPRPPHDPSQWPTIAEVLDTYPGAAPGFFVQVIDDVIYIVPDDQPVRTRLVELARAEP